MVERNEAVRRRLIRQACLSSLRRQLRPDRQPADAEVRRIFTQIHQAANRPRQAREHWQRLLVYLLSHDTRTA
jgi:hypothetical protein